MKGLIISFVAFVCISVAVVLSLGNEMDLPKNHTFAAKSEKEELVGIWEAEWKYHNDLFYCIMTIHDDGRYESVEYKNGVINEVMNNKWRADGWCEIDFYIDERCKLAKPFTHKNGILTYGSTVYRKLST